MVKKIKLIGSSIGNCGRIAGCELATSKIVEQLTEQLNLFFDVEDFVFDGSSHDLLKQQKFFTKVAAAVNTTLDNNQFPLLLGGDHSCAIGSWSGVAAKLHDDGKELALIWVDAHMDAHRPNTSETGNLHGMPVAHLLGNGHSELVAILTKNPKLKPENIVYFGIRSFEEPEEEYLKSLGIKIYYQHMLSSSNFQELFLSEFERLGQQTQNNVGITLDLDGLEPNEIAAVGTPEANGINSQIFLDTIGKIDFSKLIAFEIAEYNPLLDKDNRTMDYILQLLKIIYEAKR